MKKIFKAILIFNFSLLLINSGNAQFTHQDTLRGSNGPGRDWWDVLRYNITVTPDYIKKEIQGQVFIDFKTKATGKKIMQIDLQAPMIIDKVIFDGMTMDVKQDSPNVWLLTLLDIEPTMYIDKVEGGKGVTKKQFQSVEILFHGKPREAKRPPWDGGWIFTKDAKDRPWMSVACQGLGASVWYPCKDYQGDEPDLGASLTLNIPDTLVAVANGKLTEKKSSDGMSAYTWQVKNAINNYNIIPYLGKYVNWSETYNGEKGKLDCNYWVLDYDLDKAKEQFKQVPLMLKAFEYWFGPYPFYEDGYKLIEAPHLGMEHQSAVAYGNGFKNGYRGRDLSASGWGQKWDFIIVHESGHEWFANNITTVDIADMWVHEGFTNYSETLFTEYYYGKEAGSDYCIGTRRLIENDKPIIGPYGVNKEGSGDMYYKGGNMLHTIRHVINDDEKFRAILRGLNSKFYHSVVTTKQIENYMTEQSGKDLSKIFDQYLRTTMIPVLEYKFTGQNMYYRWTNCVDGFNMPVKLDDTKENWLKATTEWKTVAVTSDILKEGLKIDRNFYITVKKVD
ncbi:MAG TPA: M1 family metallopeptidase [Chitinophagaceae bacterium]|nr:M1 family metallopeptidase [Chitinophagaceae bacterium]